MKIPAQVYLILFSMLVFAAGPSAVHATMPARPELPKVYTYSLEAIEVSDEIPSDFEYKVTFTPHFDLEEVRLKVASSDGIEFEQEPETILGSLKADEPIIWHLKGRITHILEFDDGMKLSPILRLTGSFLYPHASVRAAIEEAFASGKGIPHAMRLEDALLELDMNWPEGEVRRVHHGWTA